MAATTAVALLFAASAPAGCVGEGPDAVLKCYSDAHDMKDASALESLYASDYTWISVAPPQAQVIDRETTLMASRKMFADEDMKSISYTFRDGYDVVEDVEEGTWRVENVRADLRAEMGSLDEPYVATTCVTFYVRELPGDGAGYEIYREVTFDGIGCGDE
jgi:hypothetical protein